MAALQGARAMSEEHEEADDIHTEVRTRLKEEDLIHNFYYYF